MTDAIREQLAQELAAERELVKELADALGDLFEFCNSPQHELRVQAKIKACAVLSKVNK